MVIRLKESIITQVGEQTHLIRNGRAAQIKGGYAIFYDTSGGTAVGFTKECCLSNPQLFSVERNIQDRDVSLSDVRHALKESSLTPEEKDKFLNIIERL